MIFDKTGANGRKWLIKNETAAAFLRACRVKCLKTEHKRIKIDTTAPPERV